MILIYRIVLFAVMYLAVVWLIVRYVFTPHYMRLLNHYRTLVERLEQADTAAFIRTADNASKALFWIVALAFAAMVLTTMYGVALPAVQ